MTRLLRRLWDDDAGAVLSVELVLVLGVLVFGAIAGFVALRNSVIAAFATVGNTLLAITPNTTFSGYSVGPVAGGGNDIAAAGGIQMERGAAQYLSGFQVVPPSVSYLVVLPAP
jgi:Flp pilus assembly pilin Flp